MIQMINQGPRLTPSCLEESGMALLDGSNIDLLSAEIVGIVDSDHTGDHKTMGRFILQHIREEDALLVEGDDVAAVLRDYGLDEARTCHAASWEKPSLYSLACLIVSRLVLAEQEYSEALSPAALWKERLGNQARITLGQQPWRSKSSRMADAISALKDEYARVVIDQRTNVLFERALHEKRQAPGIIWTIAGSDHFGSRHFGRLWGGHPAGPNPHRFVSIYEKQARPGSEGDHAAYRATIGVIDRRRTKSDWLSSSLQSS